MNPPEQVEATNSASQAVRATPRAVQSRQQDGQHHDGQNDASKSSAAQLKVEDLQGDCDFWTMLH